VAHHHLNLDLNLLTWFRGPCASSKDDQAGAWTKPQNYWTFTGLGQKTSHILQKRQSNVSLLQYPQQQYQQLSPNGRIGITTAHCFQYTCSIPQEEGGASNEQGQVAIRGQK
jgi:hypothetical protein